MATDRNPIIGDTDEETEEKNVFARIAKPTWRHYVVCPVAVTYIFAYIMSWNTMVQYTYDVVVQHEFPNDSFSEITKNSRCSVNVSSPVFHLYQIAQMKASHWNMYFSIALGLPAIASNIILGPYIDRLGRKFLMVTCIVGTLFRVIVMAIGIATKMQLSIFILGFIIEGCSGYFINFFEACHAYVADITKIGQGRSFGMAAVALMMGGGMAISMVVSGMFIQFTGFYAPIGLSSALLVVNCLAVTLILPETMTEVNRSENKSIMTHVRNVFSFYVTPAKGKRWKYVIALAAFFFMYVTMVGRYGVETLFQLNQPFCWNPLKVGLYGGLRSGLQDVVGLVMVKVLRTSVSDVTLGIIGTLSATGYQLTLAFADTDATLYIATAVGIFSILPLPMTRTIVSEMTPSDRQGAVFASFSVIETICHMTSSVAASAIYSSTLQFFRGFVFLYFGLCSLIAFVLFMILFLVPKVLCKSCQGDAVMEDFPRRVSAEVRSRPGISTIETQNESNQI